MVLTPDAKKYIKMALDENKANGRSDKDYIFVNKSGERMHEYAVNNVLRRCNGVRNIIFILLHHLQIKRMYLPKFSSQRRCNKKFHKDKRKKP